MNTNTKNKPNKYIGSDDTLKFSLSNLTSNGFPVQDNEAFEMLLDNASSGGNGTAYYLKTMLKFSDLAQYLNDKGLDAYTIDAGLNNSLQATATDGISSLCINVTLNENLEVTQAYDGTPVQGIATVQLSLPDPENINKIVNFGISVLELPPTIVVTQQLWQALFKPLLSRLTKFVQGSIENWLETEVGDDIEGLGDTLSAITEDTASTVSEETADIVVEEEVVAELAVDLSMAAVSFGALAILVAVPIIVKLLEKKFILHIEVTNETDIDLNWSIPYMNEGGMATAPQDSVIPKMSKVKDIWGDETNTPVMFQADYIAMNKSGFSGIGFVIGFSQDEFENQDFAAVISIPWISNNSIALCNPDDFDGWEDVYNQNSFADNNQIKRFENQRFATEIAIDALDGQGDEYHVSLRIQKL
ncbi:hypothetical protein SAMN05421780_10416 [Flexibacter flexilis DSM 6793]|uniref:Uncharacterized protein n=1 Tax=Flexibacter flexilis DSM 6793 TaxID=927664 RepID=A0A1I1HM54_9BACT|nr:hypothetical protein [Flexibacter flexilis]SFC24941.1 hypothetical protein SAMN05421780_10416 [Flexibacter flexilis DSM 6793]